MNRVIIHYIDKVVNQLQLSIYHSPVTTKPPRPCQKNKTNWFPYSFSFYCIIMIFQTWSNYALFFKLLLNQLFLMINDPQKFQSLVSWHIVPLLRIYYKLLEITLITSRVQNLNLPLKPEQCLQKLFLILILHRNSLSSRRHLIYTRMFHHISTKNWMCFWS